MGVVDDGLTPALAGSTPALRGVDDLTRTHPRSRGEHSRRDSDEGVRKDSPPLSRGAQLHWHAGGHRVGLTPALAGSTRRPDLAPRPEWTHPRSRGEHPTARRGTATASDSPPLSRGAPQWRQCVASTMGLTPALAGSTVRTLPSPGEEGTHPRSRGEHNRVDADLAPGQDSPPLSRGALGGGLAPGAGFGLTPALAGSTRTASGRSRRSGTHPRSRGEHAWVPAARVPPADSPPLSRGAHRVQRADGEVLGLTPALAGSTGTPPTMRRSSRTHPRSRGEHLQHAGEDGPGTDSPPLSRGARG